MIELSKSILNIVYEYGIKVFYNSIIYLSALIMCKGNSFQH